MGIFSGIVTIANLIGQFISAFKFIWAAWSKEQKEKEAATIDQAAKDAEQAKTDADLKKAAEEAANATRHL